MRYLWASVCSVTALVVAVASCGGTGKSQTGAGSESTSASTGTGGSRPSTSSTLSGGGSSSANSAGTGLGGGFITTVGSSSSGGMCAAYKSCSDQKITCGTAADGCGDILNCGTCASGSVCTAGACVQTCTPTTCAKQGFTCGMANDGCSGTIDCGSTCPTGETCQNNNCSTGICTPKTCATAGPGNTAYTCGMQSDGCSGTLNCGTCGTNDTCMAGTCVASCVPQTCAQIGASCGPQSDGCGGVVDCGTCGAGLTCSGLPSTCNSGGTACTGLCKQQQTCPGTGTTSITGTVYAPNGTDVLPSALVYVPNAALSTFVDGVNTPHCACTDDVSGSPLVSAITNYDGTFTINNMPVGTNIPLVIQKGRWRRSYTIPTVAACTNTALPTAPGATQLRMPQKQAEFTATDNIPLMAFVTGDLDALECVLRKVGIADSQFSDPTGTGRVRFYKGSGDSGSTYSNKTPSETTLWGNQTTVNGYDIVYFACQGDDFEKTAAQQKIMVNYANAGGRIFATHYSYVWLTNTAEDAVWTPTATWDQADETDDFASDPETGYINTASSDPRPTILAKWLQFIGASTTYGQMSLATLRNDMTAVNTATSLLWLNLQDANLGNVPMHYTFDTPINTAPANQCGRVLYSDFHVEDAVTNGTTFPNECTTKAVSPQEKMLEFMIFDLGSCVTPAPACVPSTCAAQGLTCGEAADGCGNILMCGACPSGESCIAGVCKNTCTALTCTGQGFTCGEQSDGCGNVLNCGTCPSGVCNNGTCTSGTCTPITACPPADKCGTISDGCSNTINCGTCTAPETCGGGGIPNQCGAPKCTPKTCAEQGFNCGNATDGCSNTINCGTCIAPQTCGGGEPPVGNVCGGIQGT